MIRALALAALLAAPALAADPVINIPATPIIPPRAYDLEYRHLPTRTLSRAVIIPGGGWFHLAQERDGSYRDGLAGAGFLAATLAAAAFTSNQLRRGKGQDAFMGGVLFWLARAFDVTTSTDEAARRDRR